MSFGEEINFNGVFKILFLSFGMGIGVFNWIILGVIYRVGYVVVLLVMKNYVMLLDIVLLEGCYVFIIFDVECLLDVVVVEKVILSEDDFDVKV